MREQVIITTELVDYKGLIGNLKQTIVKADGSIATEALFKMALFDTAQRKLIPPTPEWSRAVGKQN